MAVNYICGLGDVRGDPLSYWAEGKESRGTSKSEIGKSTFSEVLLNNRVDSFI